MPRVVQESLQTMALRSCRGIVGAQSLFQLIFPERCSDPHKQLTIKMTLLAMTMVGRLTIGQNITVLDLIF